MRAVDLLEVRRFIEVERQPRVGNRYTLTHPTTWYTNAAAQPIPGGTAQPASSGVAPPDKVRELLRHFTQQVALSNQAGGVVRPERVFRTSEQEEQAERCASAQAKSARPAARSQAEQLAFVAEMTKPIK
jgi:hypothetical protein